MALVALAGVACGGPRIEYVAAEDDSLASERMPLAVGNSWTFVVTDDDDAPVEKTQQVLDRRRVGLGPNASTMAFFLVTTRTGEGALDRTESWQGVELDPDAAAPRVVRYRELSYDASTGEPEMDEFWNLSRLRVDDFHDVATGTWTEEFEESKLPVGDEPKLGVPQTETWSVASDDEVVVVPAGTFHAVTVVRHGKEPKDDKTYWFAKGVGKVKERGGKTEELVDCVVGGAPCSALAR